MHRAIDKTEKLLLVGILLSSLIAFSAIAPDKARAGVSCVDQSRFPGGWAIDHGLFNGDSIFATSGTLGGVTNNYLTIHKNITPNPVYGLTYWVSITGLGDQYPTYVTITTRLSSVAVDTYSNSFDVSVGTGNWNSEAAIFNQLLQNVDEIDITMSHNATGRNGSLDIGIKVTTYCYNPDQPITSTPVNTNTPQPSFTPVPTDTLTPSYTPTDTNTPTATLSGSETAGPSPTLGPSRTLGPTGTPVPSKTLGGVAVGFGGGKFNTAPAPGGCGDTADNPCGPLPFSPPNFSVISLDSPTPIASFTANATITAMAGSGPGATVVAYSTALNDSVNNVIAMSTITINGPGGTPVGLAQAGSDLGGKLGDFFGLLRSITGINLGKSGVLIAFLLLATAFIIFVRFVGLVIRIAKAIFSFVLQLIKTVIPFA